MNTLNIIITLIVPIIVIVYIIWELRTTKYAVEPIKMSYDKNIDNINLDGNINEGDRLSQSERLQNVQHIINTYKNIL
jgi:hypothetical protein